MWHHRIPYAEAHHAYYAGHTIAHHGGWLGHTIVSAVIHGLIYGAIFRLMRGMSIGEVLLVAVVGVAVVGVAVVGGGWWLWNRR